MATPDKPDEIPAPPPPAVPPFSSPASPPELMHGELFYDPETGFQVMAYRDGGSGEWIMEFGNRDDAKIPTAIRRLTAMRLSAVLSQWITTTTPTKPTKR